MKITGKYEFKTEAEYKGVTHTLSEWSCILGLSFHNLVSRLEEWNGDVDKAFTAKEGKRVRMIYWRGETKNLTEWAKELDIPYNCLRSRLNCVRWDVDKAFSTPYKPNKKYEDNKKGE